MFEIHFTDQACRTFSQLDFRTQESIRKIIATLERGDFEQSNIMPIRGPVKGHFRYWLGNWRIIFQVDIPKQDVIIKSILTNLFI